MSSLQFVGCAGNTLPCGGPSKAACQRILSRRGEPFFLADWMRVLMIHFQVDAEALQRDVPFQPDLLNGRAFVSVVAFTMENMRPRVGGRLTAWLFKPIATHDFLNVRTYVRHGGEVGIHFMAEWLSNRIAVKLGPRSFGLPYRHGRIVYQHAISRHTLTGSVKDVMTKRCFSYRAELEFGVRFVSCAPGSLDEWLMERYAAFNCARGRKKFFRIWHPPWPQCRAAVNSLDDTLLTSNWPWFREARLIGANFSPGLRDVWMGRPYSVT